MRVDKYIDKATLFVLCAVFYVEYHMDIYIVVPLICVVIVSAFLSYINDGRVRLGTATLYLAACVFYPVLLFFLPVIAYDVFNEKYQAALLLAVIPAWIGFQTLPLASSIIIVLFAGLSYLMKRRTLLLDKTRNEYIALRDTAKEFSLQLESKNKELMEKQDYEINLATLNERNRIARDISRQRSGIPSRTPSCRRAP
jgi:signal transduction histidine kinase